MMMKYTIIVKFNTDTKLVFRVKAEKSKDAVIKVMNELSDIQSHFMTDIRIIEEAICNEIIYKEL